MPKLTIWLITYNHENTIKQCIDSILSQDFRDYELIIVDNNSSDSTPEILRAYAKNDSRISLKLHTENKFYGYRMDEIVDEAKGEYFFGFSGDDWIQPGMIKKAMNVAYLYDADFVYTGFAWNYFDEQGKLCKRVVDAPDIELICLSPKEISENMELIIKRFHLESEQHLLRRVKFLRDNNIFFRNIGWDTSYVALLFFKAKRFIALPDIGYNYRTYINFKAKNKTNAISNDMHMNQLYVEYLPKTYNFYKSICENNKADYDYITNKFYNSFFWVITEYIPNTVDMNDTYYNKIYFSPLQKIRMIEELITDESIRDLIDYAGDYSLLNELSKSIKVIVDECKDNTERIETVKECGWLVQLASAFFNLKREKDYNINESIKRLSNAIYCNENRNKVGIRVIDKLNEDLASENQLFYDLLNKLKKKKTVIYGAGKIGQEYGEILSHFGIVPDLFIDKFKTGELNGILVKSLEDFIANYNDENVVIAIRDKSIREELTKTISTYIPKENIFCERCCNKIIGINEIPNLSFSKFLIDVYKKESRI